MKTEKETENTNEIIWIDEVNLKKQQLELIKITTNLNRLIVEAERVLNRLLTAEEKQKIRFDGVNFVENEVRKLFKFPNATDEFNMQSLGMDLSAVRKYKTMDWVPFEFELDDIGIYVATEKQPLFERYYYYADTENKKKVLKLASTLVQLVNEAKETDSIDTMHIPAMCLAFKSMVLPHYKQKDRSPSSITVNFEGIAKYSK